jgi:putative nucleotidyltransferase with HDIG domain
MDDRQKLFNEIDDHLLGDAKPSQYLQNLNDPTFETTHPFTMLSRLKGIKQSPQHHPEGSVWNHTLLVLDEAAARKDQATDSRVFMWAALLHDVGKAATTKIRKGKITAYDHDKAGAQMSREFLQELEDEPFISEVAVLVRWHMQILYVTKNMHFANLDTMRKETNVRDVALLGLCDRLGRLGADKLSEMKAINDFLRKAGTINERYNQTGRHRYRHGVGAAALARADEAH